MNRTRLYARTACVTALAAMLLTACGGGGSDSNSPPSGGSTPQASTLKGVVAQGAPLANVTVTAIQADGTPCGAATTGQDGSYTLQSACTVPFAVQTGSGTAQLTAPWVNSQTAASTLNLTPLSTALFLGLTGQNGVAGLNGVTQDQLGKLQGALLSALQSLYPVGTYGVDWSKVDLVGTPFSADHTGLDHVLDNLSVTTSSSKVSLVNTQTSQQIGLDTSTGNPLVSYTTATGAMNHISNATLAVRLLDGTVLAVGDAAADGSRHAERYDPASGAWTVVATPAYDHLGGALTLLANGKVLATGADGSAPDASSAELYDPAANTWTTLAAMPDARSYHAAVLLPNGKVLVVAGSDRTGNFGGGYYATTQLFDPASGTWSAGGSMSTGRMLPSVTVLANGKVLVAGGTDNDGNVLASAELYDPATNSWSTAASMSQAREDFAASLLADGRVLVAGGLNASGDNAHALATAEIYDPASNAWSAAGTMGTTRYNTVNATLLPNGLVMISGGQDDNTGYLAAVDLYDPVAQRWITGTSLSIARLGAASVLLASGDVLIAGGLTGDSQGVPGQDLSSAERYTASR